MIAHASDLLRAFIDAETKALAEGPEMHHMPTLGEAYEAITRDGIDQRFVLPPGLDLRVVPGFIDGSANQFDCMLVRGDGKRYGRTNKFVYPIDKVLCVFEVKKNLRKTDLADSINHLADVQKLFAAAFENQVDGWPFQAHRGAVRSFERMTGRTGPDSYPALDAMPLQDRALMGYLARQRHAPVTVVLGYEGLKTESGLRRALERIVEGEIGKPSNTSIDLLPTLMMCGDLCVVKCNAQPYMVQREGDGWVAVASTRDNAALILLELLWTKISSFCNVGMPFGDDMTMESLKELFTLRAVPHDDGFGWVTGSFEYTEAQLMRPSSIAWEPARLSAAAMAIANRVALGGGSTVLDDALSSYVQKTFGVSMEAALAELAKAEAFARSADSLRTTSQVTFLASLEDDTGFVAVDREKLVRWLASEGLEHVMLTIVNL
jgi:hypothetical protein